MVQTPEEWFECCSPRKIYPFAGLIKAFCKHLDHSYEKEEHVEDLVDACQYRECEIRYLTLACQSNPLNAFLNEINDKYEAIVLG
jgi:hypothetical protein